MKCSNETRESRNRVEDQKKRKKETARAWNRRQFKNMVDINPSIQIITLNINGLNTSTKRQRLSANDKGWALPNVKGLIHQEDITSFICMHLATVNQNK